MSVVRCPSSVVDGDDLNDYNLCRALRLSLSDSGQGYATEVAAAWLRYGFEEANLARVVAVADPENAGSRRVMEKLGMRYEKNERHYGKDCVFYAISREEFRPREGFYALREDGRAGANDR